MVATIRLAVDDDSMWRSSANNELGAGIEHQTTGRQTSLWTVSIDISTHPVRSPSDGLNVRYATFTATGIAPPPAHGPKSSVRLVVVVVVDNQTACEQERKISFRKAVSKCAPSRRGFGDKTHKNNLLKLHDDRGGQRIRLDFATGGESARRSLAGTDDDDENARDGIFPVHLIPIRRRCAHILSRRRTIIIITYIHRRGRGADEVKKTKKGFVTIVVGVLLMEISDRGTTLRRPSKRVYKHARSGRCRRHVVPIDSVCGRK